MKYGVQLYTLRKYTNAENGIENVFKKLKDMNIDMVQVSGINTFSPQQMKNLKDKYSIEICGTHSSYERITTDIDNLAKEHLLYEAPTVGLGSMPSNVDNSTLGSILKFCDELNDAGKKLKPYGLTIAYHNHSFEFKQIGDKTIFDILIENTDKSVKFIPDTYWIKVGGEDPAEFLKKLDGRVDIIHFKDHKKIFGIPSMQPIGQGTINFQKVIDVGKQTGAEYSVFELDNSLNPFKAIQTSFNNLKKLEL